jgi:glycosyltransferase involved in cell wall biosynthesis
MASSTRERYAVHQVLATLGYGDAIGNEALGIRRVLRDAGYDSNIYVQTVDPRLEDQTSDYRDLLDDAGPETVLLHHFSIGSRASRVAYALPSRMALIYHNITPPEYFIGVNPTLVQLCYTGRRELGAYARRVDLALGDSEFNRVELESMGFPRTGVLPVVPSFDHLDGPPSRLLAADFDDTWTNILFVGRTIPSKRLEDLIRFFHTYRLKYNPASRLLLVGNQSGFGEYVAALHDLIATLRVPDVHLIGHVSNAELTGLYDVADLFVSASEHEGFCVPLIEAFYKRIPVIAFDATAVPATMDGGGVLYDYKDPRHVASLMHAVLSNAALEAEVLRSQDAALDRLRRQEFGGTLLRFVEDVLASPRLDLPEITWDFWRQFDRSEELDELRQYRPSAFGALAKEPAGDQGPG